MNSLLRRSLLTQINITRAGQKLRMDQNRMRSGNEDGPLHDLPDFHFADGRAAPITAKQEKWMKTRENEQNILNRIKSEVEQDRAVVIDKIKGMEDKILKTIKIKQEKKKQRETLFNNDQTTEKKE
ncbi:hypothetical protein DICPUDRAFT_35306 [Dictyostelium purpureum]|uniref:Large ribosomal subunit protein mL52 n=1 Tax=Dictyostelium purpureum TaxID=5786 RepID=F0ZP50_DICPU|nr:uncharacterized protein DICPUDRAFT_35306 [Dictyostelium purpureum]EGC34265.1 hypothetical protein DICPUDRAFT_35306 [Dictyostelium purpureum]|eukprot:XP_003289194.1 hypothetical protein DICPUDRAFT_35306 [Dictyostelium purpureum]